MLPELVVEVEEIRFPDIWEKQGRLLTIIPSFYKTWISPGSLQLLKRQRHFWVKGGFIEKGFLSGVWPIWWSVLQVHSNSELFYTESWKIQRMGDQDNLDGKEQLAMWPHFQFNECEDEGRWLWDIKGTRFVLSRWVERTQKI